MTKKTKYKKGLLEEECRSSECNGNEGLSKKCNCSKYEEEA